jgi:hypothetical protein
MMFQDEIFLLENDGRSDSVRMEVYWIVFTFLLCSKGYDLNKLERPKVIHGVDDEYWLVGVRIIVSVIRIQSRSGVIGYRDSPLLSLSSLLNV